MLKAAKLPLVKQGLHPQPAQFHSLHYFSATRSQPDRGGGRAGQGEKRQRGVDRQTPTTGTVSQEECRQCRKPQKQFSNPGKMVWSLGWHTHCEATKGKLLGPALPPARGTLRWSWNVSKSQVEEPLEISETPLLI